MNRFAISKRVVMMVMSTLLLILLFPGRPSDVMATTAPHTSGEQASAVDTYTWAEIKLLPNADVSVLQAALLNLQTQGLVREVERQASAFRVLASPDVFSQLKRLKGVAQVIVSEPSQSSVQAAAQKSTDLRANTDPRTNTPDSKSDGVSAKESDQASGLRPYWLLLKPSHDTENALPALLRQLARLQADGLVKHFERTVEQNSLKVLASDTALDSLHQLPNVLDVAPQWSATASRRLQGGEGGAISGSVTDEEGHPLAEISVDVYRYNNQEEGYWEYAGSASSNSDGSYEVGGLSVDRYRVCFLDSAGGYISECYDNAPNIESATDIQVAEGSTTSQIDATLSEGGHITGTLTDEEGDLLSDIVVEVYRYRYDWNGWEYAGSAFSNSDGSYDVGGLNTGTYRVGFFDQMGSYLVEYYDEAPDLERATDISVTIGLTTSAIDATLASAGHITGTVTDSDGNALSEISVEVYHYNQGYWEYARSAVSNSDGSYDAGGLKTGTYRVGFFDYSHQRYIGEYYDNVPDVESATDISVTVGETTPNIDVSLSEGGHITGTVTDSEGNPLPNMSLEVYHYHEQWGGWEQIAYGYTTLDGSYDVGGLNTGIYRVHFLDYSGIYAPEYYDNALDFDSASDISVTVGETTANIDASLSEGGHITGTVTDAEGNVLPDISVEVYHYNQQWGGWEYVGSASSNSDGSYDVGGLNTGTYRLRFFDYSGIYAPEYYDNALDLESASDISVTVGETTANIDASLSEAGHITGTVTDSEGNPLSNISLQVYHYNEQWGGWEYVGSASSNSDGSYDVGGLNTGTYRVGFFDYSSIYMPEYYDNALDLESASDISVIVGETTPNIDASLSEGGHLTGTVTDAEGNPLPDISLEVYHYHEQWGGWGQIAYGYTTSDGSYDVGGLNTGTYRLRFLDYSGIYAAEYYDKALDLESASDISVTVGETTTNIDASLSEAGHITGIVTDSEGNPLPNMSLEVYHYHQGYWQYARSAISNSDGSYDVGGLNTGTYRMGFFDYSYQRYIAEYYDNAPTVERASDISVIVGETTANIDASLSEGGHITGIVSNEEGAGLRNVYVTAFKYEPDYDYWMWAMSTYTGSDGSYDLSGLGTGDYRVGYWHDSGQYVSEYYDDAPDIESGTDVHVIVAETTANIDAVLAKGGHITGLVSDAEGNGLSNIIVEVYRYNVSLDEWEWVAATNTNYFGQYEVSGLRSDEYRVRFWDGAGLYASEYYDDATTVENATDVPVTIGAITSDIDAVLIEGGHITGTIRDADGNPLSDIIVEIYRYRADWSYWEYVGNGYSNQNGSYDAGGLNTGSYQVGFLDYSGHYITEYYDDAVTLDEANDVAVTVGSTTADINAQLSQGGHISGRVTNAEGRPLSDISIDVYRYNSIADDWEWISYGYTDYNGMYNAAGLATDSYRVGFYDWQGRYLTEYYNDQPALESANDITVTVGETTSGIDAQLGRAGSIEGTVSHSDGTALANIEVEVYLSDGSGGWNWAGWAYTNHLGQYTVGSLSSGSYRVSFSDWSGHYFSKYYDNASDLSSALDVSVLSGSPTTGIDIMLEEGGHIKGQVSSERSGEPLAGIEVVAYRNTGSSESEWINSTVTDEDGMYDISGLATGNYVVGFFESSGTYAYEYYDNQMSIEEATPVSVSAGESTANIDAALGDPVAAVAEADSESGSVVVNPQTGQITIMQPVGNPTNITIKKALSCPDGEAPSNVLLYVGTMPYPMSDNGELFSATIPAAKLENGAQISIKYLCGNEEVTWQVAVIVLYDPSGYITDATTGQAIVGATVTLYNVPGWQARNSAAQNSSANTCESNKSKSANQAWSQAAPTTLGTLAVANSGQIDPAMNPLITNEQGYYGWDVAAGCWYVVVEASGYQALTSPVVGVPPEVTDLNLKLTRSLIPTVALEQSNYQVSERSASVDLNVTLSAAFSETITVNYATANGTATAGSDYTTATGVLTFEAGETSKTVQLTILNDSLVETNETLSLSLSSPSNATLGRLSRATVTILDDDKADPSAMKIYFPLVSR